MYLNVLITSSKLWLIFWRFHLKNVRHDRIDLDISNQASKEQFFQNVRLDRSEWRQAQEKSGKSGVRIFLRCSGIVSEFLDDFVSQHFNLSRRTNSHLIWKVKRKEIVNNDDEGLSQWCNWLSDYHAYTSELYGSNPVIGNHQRPFQ